MDLLDALRRPEGKTLEFKRDLSSPDGLLKTVVAFANTAGGTILLGVEDGTRQVRGVAEPLALEERLANLMSDSITPRLLPNLEIHAYRKTQVVAVQVFPSPTRPHHLAKAGPQAGTYVRVGSTNRRADDALIAEMQRFARGAAFDEQAMPELNSEAIDFRVASESFAPLRKLARRDLETLRLLTLHQGRKVPTVGEVLLFGTDRPRHFPDAWIQVGRFLGTDKTTILDHADYSQAGAPIRRIPSAATSRRNLNESDPCHALQLDQPLPEHALAAVRAQCRRHLAPARFAGRVAHVAQGRQCR